MTGVAPGVAEVSAEVDGKRASSTVTVLDGGVVSNGGATLNVKSGVVRLVVPPGALASKTNLSVVAASAVAGDPRIIKGTAFEFGPSGTSFANDVMLAIAYDPANLAPGEEQAALEIYLLVGADWQDVPGSTVDLVKRMVSAPVSHFSTYAVHPGPPVATIAISGPPERPIVGGASSLIVGGTQQLAATPRASDGTILVHRVVTWASSGPTIANVSADGVLAALTPGSAIISATAGGKTTSIAVTVTPEPVATVGVTLAAGTIVAGATTQATATTRDVSNNILTGRVIEWSSDALGIGTVDVNTGLVTAVAPGTAHITATSEGKSGTATITVTPVPVANVTVSLAASSIVMGTTTQATATTRDGGNNILTGRAIAWSSDAQGVATVDVSTGVVAAVAPGTAHIKATSEGKSGTATITVTPVPVATVTVSLGANSIEAGLTTAATAVTRDAANNILAGRLVTWSSSADAVATVSQTTGVVTGVASGTATITATSEGKSGGALVTVTPSLSAIGPLRVSAQNPRYFETPGGQVVYVTGSHTWGNLKDNGTTDPPPAFDYPGYLDFLETRGHNFFKMYVWEQQKWTAEISDDYWFSSGPFQRTGPGTALDGKPRFDLTKLDQSYFDRLRSRVVQAQDRGIYVSVMLFNGWSIATKGGAVLNNPWKGHPFNASNNINGIDPDSDHDGLGLEVQTLGNSAITALQDAYVKKVIDAVNDLDNVLFEISNESDPSSKAWQYHMIQLIRDYEATKPKHHPVGMTAIWPDGTDADLLNSAADWISTAGDMSDPPAATGAKVLLSDTDHLCGVCGDVAWVWRSLTRGHNPILMDAYDGAAIGLGAGGFNPADPIWEAIRKNMGYAREYAQRLDLAAAVPRGDLVSSGYGLAKVGAQYLVFIPNGGSVNVDLSAVAGSLNVEWFNPATGHATVSGTVAGGATRTLSPPFGGSAVLFLH